MKYGQSILFIVLFVFFTNVYSQTPNEETNSDSLIFGKHSLQFRINNLFSLSSFNGSLLSYKYHTSDRNAYRISVGIFTMNGKEEKKIRKAYRDTLEMNHDLSNNETGISLTFEFINYINPSNDIKIFWGIGPRINIKLNDFDTDNISIVDTSNYDYYKIKENNYYEAGLTGVFGVEWFFRKNMSLHAEYSFNFSYYYKKYSSENIGYNNYYKYETSEKYSYTDNGILFTSNPVRFGLSIYF